MGAIGHNVPKPGSFGLLGRLLPNCLKIPGANFAVLLNDSAQLEEMNPESTRILSSVIPESPQVEIHLAPCGREVTVPAQPTFFRVAGVVAPKIEVFWRCEKPKSGTIVAAILPILPFRTSTYLIHPIHY